MDKENTRYYTYVLTDPSSNRPFYVGMAKASESRPVGFRASYHIQEAINFRDRNHRLRGANLRKLRTIINILATGNVPHVVIVSRDMDKAAAIRSEKWLIELFGRKDLSNGCLTNLTSGGEGVFNLSEDALKRRIASQIGKPSPSKGRKFGSYDEERVKAAADGVRKFYTDNPGILSGRTCRPLTDDHKKKLSDSLKGRPSPMKGRTPWNKGIKTGPMTDEAKHNMRGRSAHNKGKTSPNSGKTYEELYGPEKAKALRESKRQSTQARWLRQKSTSGNDLKSAPEQE